MAVFRVPSKKIQYGYIEVEVDTENLSAAEAAAMYIEYVSQFQMAEVNYVQAKLDAKPVSKVIEAEAEADAEKLITEELKATKVSEVSENPAKADEPAVPPWEEKPEAPAKKAWEADLVFDWD